MNADWCDVPKPGAWARWHNETCHPFLSLLICVKLRQVKLTFLLSRTALHGTRCLSTQQNISLIYRFFIRPWEGAPGPSRADQLL
jgi:hypothetical protein